MGVSGVIKPPKVPRSSAAIYRVQKGGGDIPLYSVLFRPHGLLETLFGKITVPEKNIATLKCFIWKREGDLEWENYLDI